MRTTEEILARITDVAETDVFGAERTALVEALPFDAAAPFMVAPPDEDAWVEATKATAEEKLASWLPIAAGCAESHLAVPARRAWHLLRGWVWLLGDEQYNSINWDAYDLYGAPVLKECFALAGLDWPADNERLNRMADGLPCVDDCQEGCVSNDEQG